MYSYAYTRLEFCILNSNQNFATLILNVSVLYVIFTVMCSCRGASYSLAWSTMGWHGAPQVSMEHHGLAWSTTSGSLSMLHLIVKCFQVGAMSSDSRWLPAIADRGPRTPTGTSPMLHHLTYSRYLKPWQGNGYTPRLQYHWWKFK